MGIDAEPYWAVDEDSTARFARAPLNAAAPQRTESNSSPHALGMLRQTRLAFSFTTASGFGVHYYQQWAAPGAPLPDAFAVLSAAAVTAILPTTSSRPPSAARVVEKILAQLELRPTGFTLGRTAINWNAPRAASDHALKLLSLESPAPLLKLDIVGNAHRRRHSRHVLGARRTAHGTSQRSKPGWSNTSSAFLPHGNSSPANWTNTTRRHADVALSVAGEPLLAEQFPPALAERPAAISPTHPSPIKAPQALGQKTHSARYQFTGKVSESLRAGTVRRAGDLGDRRLGRVVRAGKYSTAARFDDRWLPPSWR